MFLLGITRAPTWMEERFLSLILLRHTLLRFRLIFSSTNSDISCLLKRLLKYSLCEFASPSWSMSPVD